MSYTIQLPVPGARLKGILGGGVPPGSPTPDPVSDQKCYFPHPFSDLQNPYPFSDLEAFKKSNMHVNKDRNYIIITEMSTQKTIS